MQVKGRDRRFLLVALGMLALLAAMWAGLLRMGWAVPLVRAWPGAHGPLMVSGFLGTLIGLERAVALKEPWMFLAPLLSGVGGLALIVGLPYWLGAALITLGSTGLVAIFAVIVRKQNELFNQVMTLASVLGLVGNLLWLTGRGVSEVVLWWAGYLILTIAGERLELSRLLALKRPVRAAFVAAVVLYLLGAMLALWQMEWGWRVAGLGMVTLAAWLLRYDVARRTIRNSGLPRFVAICLLTGFVWLGVAGLIALAGRVSSLFGYDAILHAVFLGFVIGMIFGHAPVIFPAVLGVPVPYRLAFYSHLVLLDLSLAVRIAGDLGHWVAARQWGGMINVIAMLLFLGNTLLAVRSSRGAQA